MVTRAKLTLDPDRQSDQPETQDLPIPEKEKPAAPEQKKSGKVSFILTAGLTVVSLILFKRKIF